MSIGGSLSPAKRLDLCSHRICPSGETVERIYSKMREFGITRVANITGLDRVGIPVTLAIRPNSKSVAVSQGKGRSLDDAKASAIMEATEIWHAENIINDVLYGSEADLKSRHVIADTSRLPEMAGAEYDNTQPNLWIEGTDIVSGKMKLVPFEMVHLNYTRPTQPMHGVFHASSNGLASGNHRLEAICHAITELIERDAMTLWHFLKPEQQARTRISPESIDADDCVELLQKFHDAELEVGIWDVTSDSDIPSIMVVVRESCAKNGHIGLGAGCHLDRSIALRRALTEAAQTRLNYISGARDDLLMSEFESSGIDHKYEWADGLFMSKEMPRSLSEVSTNTFKTLEEDLDHLINRLCAIDISEVVAVRLTREEFGIEVYRLVIPGLEAPHDDASYTPGARAKKVIG